MAMHQPRPMVTSRLNLSLSAAHCASVFIVPAACSIAQRATPSSKGRGTSTHTIVAPIATPHRGMMMGESTTLHRLIVPKRWLTNGCVATVAAMLTATAA